MKEADLKAIDSKSLSDFQIKAFQRSGYLNAEGLSTSKIMGAIQNETPAYEKPLSYKHAGLLKQVELSAEGWKEAVFSSNGLVGLRNAFGVQKAGWFDLNGRLSDKALGFLREHSDKDFKYISSRLTSQHVSLAKLAGNLRRKPQRNSLQGAYALKGSMEETGSSNQVVER